MLKLLSTGGLSYPISGAYQWNLVSMDPQVRGWGPPTPGLAAAFGGHFPDGVGQGQGTLSLHLHQVAPHVYTAAAFLVSRQNAALTLPWRGPPAPAPQGIHPATTVKDGSFKVRAWLAATEARLTALPS